MRSKIRLLSAILFSLTVMSVFAQPQTPAQNDSIKVYRSPEVVVTANRVETLYDDVASTVTVLSGHELELQQVRTVSQALQSVAGLALASNGGVGKATSVFLRGANSDHTLVLLDGVELNDPGAPGNAFDFGAMMINDIEKIEVLHGSQSTLFGSNAIGGVINILTRSGVDRNRLHAELETGGYETVRLHAGFNGGAKTFNYRVAANHFSTAGFSASGMQLATDERDGYENTTLATKISTQVGRFADIELQFHHVDASGDIDHSGANGDDPNYTFDVKQTTAGAAARFSHLQNRWQHTLRMTYTDHDREALDQRDAQHLFDASNNYTQGSRLKIDWQNNFFVSNQFVAVLGVETEKESAESIYHSETGSFVFDSEFALRSVRTTGLFLQNQLKPMKNLSANLGVRIDRHSTFGRKTTYRVGVAYHLNHSMRIKATIGTGFNAPTLYEMFDPAFGNTSLKPEESTTWDIGIEQGLFSKRVMLGVTYFASRFEQMIGFDENFRSVNIDKASSRGVEVEVHAQPVQRLSLRTSYALVQTEDQSPQSEDFGQALLRRPRHRATFNMHFRPLQRAACHLGVVYSGARDDKDFETFPATRVQLKAFLLVNLSMSYQLSEKINLQGRIENLLDDRYQEVLYFNTPGRTAYLGLKSSF